MILDARSNNSAYYGVGPSNRQTAIPAPNVAAVAHRRSRSLRRGAASSSASTLREHSAHAIDSARSGPQLANIELDLEHRSTRDDAVYEDLETLERTGSSARALVGQSATHSIKSRPLPPPAAHNSRMGAKSSCEASGSLKRPPLTGLSSRSIPYGASQTQLTEEPYCRSVAGMLQVVFDSC